MRRSAVLISAMLLAGCTHASRTMSGECVVGCVEIAPPAADAARAPDALTVQQMPAPLFAAMRESADSTILLTAELIESVDAAVVAALTAAQPGDVGRTSGSIRSARASMSLAGRNADAVIRQGDRISGFVTALPTAANRPWKTGSEFTAYWTRARHQLILARNSAGQAVDAADAALGCTTPSCAQPRIAALRGHSEATSAATYMAQPLVRIAMVYASSKFGTGL